MFSLLRPSLPQRHELDVSCDLSDHLFQFLSKKMRIVALHFPDTDHSPLLLVYNEMCSKEAEGREGCMQLSHGFTDPSA